MARQESLKRNCTPKELGDLLRAMADGFDRGGLYLDGMETSWNDVEKIRISISNEGGTAGVKVKAKTASGALPSGSQEERGGERKGKGGPVSEPRKSYGSLKKSMNKTFKNILYALHEQQWPSEPDVNAFILDSAQMVRHPGKGDEFYPAYTEAVREFARAVENRDMEAALLAVHHLSTLKTQCHKRHA